MSREEYFINNPQETGLRDSFVIRCALDLTENR